jgi:DNA-binding transcriptional ArsR family regulator
MNLIDLIEKLINEQGSFKEHLELLREQISILEKENSALRSENVILKAKEDTIESELNKAAKEIERLNEIIKAPKIEVIKAPKKEVIKVLKKDGERLHLDTVTEKVLKLFFDTGQELSVNQVAGKLSMNIDTVQHHFDLLSEANLIVQTATGDKSSWTSESTPVLFELSYSGRKYVIEKKL